MRGQAFVVFKEVAEATAAKNNLNGYPIFGKPMVDIELSLENNLRRQKEQNRIVWVKMNTPSDIDVFTQQLQTISYIYKQLIFSCSFLVWHY
jgi:hypothetical protein